MQKGLLKLILVLSIAGLAISSYSFLHNQSFVSGAFCDLNATFSCDVVNKGPFSQIAGIPVALLGMFGYGFMGVAAAMRMRQPNDKALSLFSLLAACGGFAFSLYLTSLEAFVLHAWCILCLSSQAIMLTIFVSTLLSVRSAERIL